MPHDNGGAKGSIVQAQLAQEEALVKQQRGVDPCFIVKLAGHTQDLLGRRHALPATFQQQSDRRELPDHVIGMMVDAKVWPELPCIDTFEYPQQPQQSTT